MLRLMDGGKGLRGDDDCCPKGRLMSVPACGRGDWTARPAGRESGNRLRADKVGKRGEMKREAKGVKRNALPDANHFGIMVLGERERCHGC